MLKVLHDVTFALRYMMVWPTNDPILRYVLYGSPLRHFDDHIVFPSLSAAILFFVGGSLVLICILLRFLTNWCEHRNEKYNSSKPNSSKRVRTECCQIFVVMKKKINLTISQCSKSCCCSGCWFLLCVVHIAIDSALIGIVWAGWLRNVAISSLCWNILIFGVMIGLKYYQQEPKNQSKEGKTENIEHVEL